MSSQAKNNPSLVLPRVDSGKLRRALLVVAAYLAVFLTLDWLTHIFQALPGVVAWYPPDGLSFAFLLAFGGVFGPVVSLASIASSFLIYQLQLPPAALIGWAIMIPLIYWLAALLLRRGAHWSAELRNTRDVLWLTLISAGAALILAIISVSAQTAGGHVPAAEQFTATLQWWIGETVGVLVVTPVLLVHIMPWLKRFVDQGLNSLHVQRPFRPQMLKVILQAISIVVAIYLVFGVPALERWQPLYLIVLPVIWISLDHGIGGSTIAMLTVNFVTTLALRAFFFDPVRLEELQLFMVVLTVISLFIGISRTELMQDKETILKNEGRFRALIENSADAIALLSPDGTVVYDSPAAPGLLGYSPTEWIGRNAFDLMHPDDLAHNLALFRGIAERAGTHTHTILRIRHHDGSWRWMEAAVTNLLDEPSIGAIVLNYRDVTDRIQAEATLQSSEAKYRSLVEQLPTVVYINPATDPSFTLYVSPYIQAMLGYTAEEWTGDPNLWSKSLHPEDRDRVLAKVEHIRLAGEIFRMEYRMIAKDGRTVWVDDRLSLVHDAEGRPQLWQGVMTDITERKQAEEVLQNRDVQLQEAQRIGSIGSWDWDAASNISTCSDELYRIFGRDPQSFNFTLETFLAMPVPEDRKAVEEKVRESFETHQPADYDYRIVTPQGGLRWIHSRSVVVTDEHGTLVCLYGTAQDVTDRRQTDERLRLSDEILQRVNSLVLVANEHGEIVYISPSTKTILGYEPEELLNDGWWNLTRPDPMTRKLDKDKIASGARGEIQIPEAPYERQLITRDGQQRWILWHDAQGPDNLIIGVGHDITERKQAEQRIQTQLKRLTALSEIDRAISSSFGLDISLGTVLTHVTEQAHVDAASILLFNATSNTLTYAAGRGFRTGAFKNAKTLRIGEGYAGRAVLERRSIHVANLPERNDNPRLQKVLPSEGFISYYCLPLIVKGSVKGVLEVFSRASLEPDTDWMGFLEILAGQAAIAIDNAALFNGIQRSNVELTMAYDATIEGWSKALDLRDKETEGHTQRVTDTTLHLARLFGLHDEDLVHVRRGALLHDIGKMGVPDGILLKPGPLTDEEWLVMRQHTQFAFDMLAPIHYLGPALDIPYCHHEKWDGSGYPRGLKGEQIPLAARIFALVDVWDALTSDRPYRPAWSEERAYEYIESQSGAHFDPRIVRVSLESGLLRKKPQPVRFVQTE